MSKGESGHLHTAKNCRKFISGTAGLCWGWAACAATCREDGPPGGGRGDAPVRNREGGGGVRGVCGARTGGSRKVVPEKGIKMAFLWMCAKFINSARTSRPPRLPGTAAAGRSPPLRAQNLASGLVCLFVSLGNFRPCAFRVSAGVTHPAAWRNLKDVKSNETRHISRGTGGPNNPVANQRRDWDVCNQR